MLPCDSTTKVSDSLLEKHFQERNSVSSIGQLINRIKGFRTQIGSTNVSLPPEEREPELPSLLVKSARIIKVVEAGYHKCNIPLSLSSPGNIYYECMQDLLDEVSAYSDPEVDNSEVNKLITESYTQNPKFYKKSYSAFIYFLALRMARGKTDEYRFQSMRIDDWLISIDPLKETWKAAVDLTVRKEVICTAIRQDDEALLKHHLPKFHEAWIKFTTQLVKERRENYHCYCPSISLNVYLEKLPNYWKLQKRIEWLNRYKEKFPENHKMIMRYIEHVPIDQARSEDTVKCYLYAKKTLEYCSNFLDLMGSMWFREIILCKEASPEL